MLVEVWQVPSRSRRRCRSSAPVAGADLGADRHLVLPWALCLGEHTHLNIMHRRQQQQHQEKGKSGRR